jgi:hypothetical protein
MKLLACQEGIHAAASILDGGAALSLMTIQGQDRRPLRRFKVHYSEKPENHAIAHAHVSHGRFETDQLH